MCYQAPQRAGMQPSTCEQSDAEPGNPGSLGPALDSSAALLIMWGHLSPAQHPGEPQSRFQSPALRLGASIAVPWKVPSIMEDGVSGYCRMRACGTLQASVRSQYQAPCRGYRAAANLTSRPPLHTPLVTTECSSASESGRSQQLTHRILGNSPFFWL